MSDDEEGAKKVAALDAIHGHGTGSRRITFRFGLTPVRLEGKDGRVGEAVFQDANGGTMSLPCSAFITAIGFEAAAGLPRDELVGSAAELELGVLADGLYATGWFRRGPRGTIPDNRTDAQLLAARILADLEASDPGAEKPGRNALPQWTAAVCYDDWKRIDAAETASPPQDRCRVKIPSREAMLALARQTKEPDL